MIWTERLSMTMGRMRQCGYSAEDKVAIAGLRRKMSAVLVVFLGLNLMLTLHWHGAVGIAAAVAEGLCFAAILALSWTITMRSGDEYRRELLQRSLLWGLGTTLALVCVCAYVQLVLGDAWHVPLLIVPVCLVFVTAASKVLVFRRANG